MQAIIRIATATVLALAPLSAFAQAEKPAAAQAAPEKKAAKPAAVPVVPEAGADKAAGAKADKAPAAQEPAKPVKLATRRSRAHEDARQCLELSSNTDIIRCAEKYL